SDYDDLKKCDTERFAAFHRVLLDEGIYLSPSQGEADFISIRHAPPVLARTLRAMARRLRGIASHQER
ncbi:MAG: aspartate aminotransferase family protein, partial [Endomicrobiia bacterium]|nr:aspartate aminotransferase family protein [Endomicrobiia bacterium]